MWNRAFFKAFGHGNIVAQLFTTNPLVQESHRNGT